MIDPAEFIGKLRASWVSPFAVAQSRGMPPSVTLSTPTQTPIRAMALPAAVKETLAAEVLAAGPIDWLKLVHAVNGKIVAAVDDGSPLPDDRAIVHVQVVTTSITSADSHVEAFSIIGARTQP